MLYLFLKGIIIGFAVAAPVGPIGILCIHRSLHESHKAGFITGCGAATADGLCTIIAAFGLTFISNFFLIHQIWIRLIGGVFLLYLGTKILFSPISTSADRGILQKKNLLSAYLTTLLLTLFNPMTILSFIAIFAGLGSIQASYIGAGLMVMGVTLGSLMWWLLLSSSVSIFFRKRINKNKLKWINHFSGIIILIFGISALISVI